MLGTFLGIGEKFRFQRDVLLLGGSPGPGARDWAHGNRLVLHSHEHLGRAAHQMESVEVEQEEIGRGVECAEVAIGQQRVRRRGLKAP